MATSVSRNTSTGLIFENLVNIKHNGIKVDKYNLYKYLKKQGIDYETIISRKLLPDDAYIDYTTSSI